MKGKQVRNTQKNTPKSLEIKAISSAASARRMMTGRKIGKASVLRVVTESQAGDRGSGRSPRAHKQAIFAPKITRIKARIVCRAITPKLGHCDFQSRAYGFRSNFEVCEVWHLFSVLEIDVCFIEKHASSFLQCLVESGMFDYFDLIKHCSSEIFFPFFLYEA